ncbi:hypothetical protein MPH_13435, partial [Macrophomina phaseolina MS6]
LFFYVISSIAKYIYFIIFIFFTVVNFKVEESKLFYLLYLFSI